MKLPNGYGSVTKLKDKPRRKPWMIRKRGRPIGYAKTKREALEMLAEYNKSPYNPNSDMTFNDVYDLLVEHKFPDLSVGSQRQFRSKYKASKPLHNLKYKDIRKYHFLNIIETQKTGNTKKKTREFFRAMDRVAFEFDIIEKQYSGQLPTYTQERKKEPVPFSEEEIELLWNNLDVEDVDLVLILIYTGLRSGEFSDLKVENIDFIEKTLKGGNKTAAGKNRKIPIHHRILPLIKKRVAQADGETLLNYSSKTFRIRFKRVMEHFNMKHIPHECRHTMRTRLDNENVNANIINRIMGHSGGNVGERIYTHKTIEQLREAVEKLK